MLRRFGWLFLLVLTACGAFTKTEYELKDPPGKEGKICAESCHLAYENCRQACLTEKAQCEKNERAKAESDYQSYIIRQDQSGRPAVYSEREFYSPTVCAGQKCEEKCQQTRNSCHSGCGGQVIPHTTCTAFCK